MPDQRSPLHRHPAAWLVIALAAAVAWLLAPGAAALAERGQGNLQPAPISQQAAWMDSPVVLQKLHPLVLERMQAAPATNRALATQTVIVRVQAGTDLSPYMPDAIVRPYVDPLGRQTVYGTIASILLPKLASLDAVGEILPAENLSQPIGDYDDEIPPMTDPAEVAAKVALAQDTPQNTRSEPPQAASRGWWDVQDNHHAAEAWASGYTGTGVKLLINDSGIDFCHPDLYGTWAVVTDPASPYLGWPQMFDSYSMFLYARDIYHGTTNIASGAADYADTSATCPAGEPCVYRPLGSSVNRSYNLPTSPTSASGLYHIGSHPDTRLQSIYGERVAVLVVDSQLPGVYDTILVDLDRDYSFADETPVNKNTPAACLDYWNHAASSPGPDGYNDLSGGLVYFIADGFNSIPASDWLWGGLTPANGSMVAFAILDPNQSAARHGQYVASNAAAQGVVNGYFNGPIPAYKPPYSGPGTGMVLGTGKDAKLVSNGNQYQTPFYEDGFLFAALGYDGIAGTQDDSQVINISWGDSNPTNDGWEEVSRLLDMLVRTNPTLTAVFAAGNGGPGYGTRIIPAPPNGLEVGASTQFGSTTTFDSPGGLDQITWGDISAHTDRGPGARGSIGVDITANGVIGSASEALNVGTNGWNMAIAWQGTSRSAPLAAGALALVYDAYFQRYGIWPDSPTAQAILLAGAQDQHMDPFSQGAGLLNAYQAARIAAGGGGIFSTPPVWETGDYRGETYPGFSRLVFPGQAASGVFTLTNPAPAPLTVTLSSDQMVLVAEETFPFTSSLYTLADAPSNIRPDYLVDITNRIPPGTDLLQVQIFFPFEQFDPDLNFSANQYWRPKVFRWSDVDLDTLLWNDINLNGVVNNGEIDALEYNRFNRDDNLSNTLGLWVREPLARMGDGLFIGLRHQSRTALVPITNFTIRLSFYQHAPWDWLALPGEPVVVPAGGQSVFTATLTIPADTPVGMYAGNIRAQSDLQTSNIPVIANVAAPGPGFTTGGTPPASTLYDNGQVAGYVDWAFRAEVGDWRFFFLDNPISQPNRAEALLVHANWQGPWPNDLDLHILGPGLDDYSLGQPGYFGPYTLAPLGGSISPYLGASRWSFQTRTGGMADWAAAPLQDGLHMVALHQVLHAGAQAAVPFTMTAGVLSASPALVQMESCTPALGQVTLESTLELDGLQGQAFGLALPQVFPAQPAVQDNPADPSTASTTHEFTVIQGGKIEAVLSSAAPDLDLYLLYDKNDDGVFDWNTEIAAFSVGAGANESLRLLLPTEGKYLLAVHGAAAGLDQTFDLKLLVVQGTTLSLAGLPSGPVLPGQWTANLEFSQLILPGQTWHGVAFFGTPLLPNQVMVDIEIYACGELFTPTPTPTRTPFRATRTPLPTPTHTATPTKTETPTETPLPSATPTPTETPTPTPLPSATLPPTPTQIPSSTPTATATPTQTLPPTQTPTLSPTQTSTATLTPTQPPTWTPTYTPSPTHTALPTSTATATLTHIPSVTPTETPSLTATVTATTTPSATAEPRYTVYLPLIQQGPVQFKMALKMFLKTPILQEKTP